MNPPPSLRHPLVPEVQHTFRFVKAVRLAIPFPLISQGCSFREKNLIQPTEKSFLIITKPPHDDHHRKSMHLFQTPSSKPRPFRDNDHLPIYEGFEPPFPFLIPSPPTARPAPPRLYSWFSSSPWIIPPVEDPDPFRADITLLAGPMGRHLFTFFHFFLLFFCSARAQVPFSNEKLHSLRPSFGHQRSSALFVLTSSQLGDTLK